MDARQNSPATLGGSTCGTGAGHNIETDVLPQKGNFYDPPVFSVVRIRPFVHFGRRRSSIH
jgi:hypothetical protein